MANKTTNSMPQKGDIIAVDLTGNGEEKFRVLAIEGTTAKLLAMEDAATISFGDDNTYAGSRLDKFLNEEWFGRLTDAAKAAIVPQEIAQSRCVWYDEPNAIETENPTYTYQHQFNWDDDDYDNWNVKEVVPVGERNVFALDIKDIYDYVGKRWITSAELNTLFFGTAKVTWSWVWLRSADAGTASYAMFVYGDSGRVLSTGVASGCAARPALCIDLSKVEWE